MSETPKYKTIRDKKAALVDAYQFLGGWPMSDNDIAAIPEWIYKLHKKGELLPAIENGFWRIIRLGGQQIVSPGDWIVKRSTGNLSVWNPIIFGKIFTPD